jgi:hypothetical protein
VVNDVGEQISRHRMPFHSRNERVLHVVDDVDVAWRGLRTLSHPDPAVVLRV